MTDQEVEAAIEAARSEERERCIEIAQGIMRLSADSGSTGAVIGAQCVRDAIRAGSPAPAAAALLREAGWRVEEPKPTCPECGQHDWHAPTCNGAGARQ